MKIAQFAVRSGVRIALFFIGIFGAMGCSLNQLLEWKWGYMGARALSAILLVFASVLLLYGKERLATASLIGASVLAFMVFIKKEIKRCRKKHL